MMSKRTLYVASINTTQAETIRRYLIEKGCALAIPPHTLFSAKMKGFSCTAYASGKLVVQGANIEEFIEFYLEPEVLGSFTSSVAMEKATLSTEKAKPHIGSDESGKGDLFGPLTVCALFADEKQQSFLKELKVKDCKELSDSKVRPLAKEVKRVCPYELIVLKPEKYNELYAHFRNLNHLLAWAHSAAIKALYDRVNCTNILVDKFANEYVLERALKQKGILFPIEQATKAESDIVVAAASIVARDAFLWGMEELERLFGIPFAKGGGAKTFETLKQFMAKEGKQQLPLVAKMHFKNLSGL